MKRLHVAAMGLATALLAGSTNATAPQYGQFFSERLGGRAVVRRPLLLEGQPVRSCPVKSVRQCSQILQMYDSQNV